MKFQFDAKMIENLKKKGKNAEFFVVNKETCYAVSCYEKKEEADTNCSDRNARAEGMGILTRYEVAAAGDGTPVYV